MRVSVALERRFAACAGALYVESVESHDFWQRYLQVFDHVTIIARVQEVAVAPEGWLQCTGDRVDYHAMPYYIGPYQLLRRWLDLLRAARSAARAEGAFILRVPGMMGTLLSFALERQGKPYALEVVGDPYDAMSLRVWRNPMIFVIRWIAAGVLRHQCRHALAGVSYVTSEALQKRYQPSGNAIRNYVIPTGIGSFDSTVDTLSPGERDGGSVRKTNTTNGAKLIFVGSLERMYKAPDVLLKAVALCHERKVPLALTLVGNGRYRKPLESLARELGIEEHVTFAGRVKGPKEVKAYLQKADLFVLPSVTEGLPRAMLEAMATGVPCIGTNVGGIPELLPPEDMVPPGKAEALAAKILEVLSDQPRLGRMAERGRKTAAQYSPAALEPRRREFYEFVKARTAELA